MKRNILIYSLALASIVASCAKTDLPHFGGANDPNAVTISPSVALVSTRSNPLGDAAAQTQFNEGDVITITDKADNEVYKYKLGNDGKWKPTDGKYLLWHDETLDISASYGESDIKNVKDQSTAAGIAAADYMTFSGSVSRPSDSNKLKFNMGRERYLVIVKIASYGDQYNPDTDKVSGLKISFEDNVENTVKNTVEITPFVRDENDNNVSTDGTVGYSYSAICDASYETIKISYQVAGHNREAILSSFGGPDAGYSYTINLRVGKDKIEPGEVTVGDWKDSGTAWDDVTATKIPYLTFSAESEQKFKMDFCLATNPAFGLGDGEYFEYSVGGGSWTRFTTTVSDISFGGTLGNLRLRGKSSKGTANYMTYSTISFSETNVPVNCSGDIRTMINYTDYSTVDTKEVRFKGLFKGCTQLTSAPELPATELCADCYSNMFQDCSALQSAPELPATKLSAYCYYKMFSGCTSLTSAPELKAETLASSCYSNMFNGCTALTEAPELKAETLADHCYEYMFNGCTALTTAPALPAETLADNCYYYMFSGCTALTSAPELKATNLAPFCYSSMFSRCTALTNVPQKLPATSLKNSCYQAMFSGCKSLETAPELPDSELANYCYQEMFMGCTALTEAPNLPAITLKESCYNSMFKGCTSLTTAPELKAKTLAKFCCYSMFEGCTSLTTAPELNATILAYGCYQYMFGSTGLTSAPELKAENLVDFCYCRMFDNCTKLTTAPALPATNLAPSCYSSMFSGCKALSSVTMLATDVSATNCLYEWLSSDAGTDATSRTLTVANSNAYTSIESYLPDNWKSGNATINYQNL